MTRLSSISTGSINPASRLARIGVVAVLVAASIGLIAAPASAEAAAQVTITRLSAATIPSGNPASYNIAFSCSAVTDPDCINAAITIPLDPANVGWSYSVSANPRVASAAVVGTDYVITLVSSVPAGSSSQLVLVVTPPNYTTPNGTTWSLLPTVAGSNFATAAAPAPAVSTASATFALAIDKEASSPFAVAGTAPFRWFLNVCNPSATAEIGGDLTAASGQVVDILPVGSVFSDSSAGVAAYNPATHTVTFPLDPNLLADSNPCVSPNPGGYPLWVDVLFPTASFTAPDRPVNSATVTATGIGEAAPLTANDAAETLIANTILPDPSRISKTASTTLNPTDSGIPVTYAGDWMSQPRQFEATFTLRLSAPTVQSPILYSFEDRLPCLIGAGPNYFSPTATDPLCATPAFRVDEVEAGPTLTNARLAGWRPQVRTPSNSLVPMNYNGTTGAFEVPTGAVAVSVLFPAHPLLSVTGITAVTLANIRGHADNSLAVGSILTNTADFVLGASAVPADSPPASIKIVAGAIGTILSADVFPDFYRLFVDVDSEVALTSDIVTTGLLPAGVTLSGTGVNWAELSPGGLAISITTVDNYLGTGRQLVTATVAAASIAGATNVKFYGDIPTIGGRTLAPGTYPARTLLTSADLTSCQYSGLLQPLALDTVLPSAPGTVRSCRFDSQLQIDPGPTADFSLLKSVRGDLDSSPKFSPSVATVSDTVGSAEFTLDFVNSGNQTLNAVVIYDVLPFVGDTGISSATSAFSRGSQFPVTLSSAVTVTAMPGVAVAYSASSNPCRPEVNAAPPAGCDSNWVADPASIGGLSAVRAIRLTAPPVSTAFPFARRITAKYTVSTPPVNAGEIAWNTAAAFALDSSGGRSLLPVETPRVGLGRPFSDVRLTKVQIRDAQALGQTASWEIIVEHGTTSTTAANGVVTYTGRTEVAPGTATNVVVSDVLPPGWALVSATPAAGTFNSATGQWSVGNVNVNDRFVMTVVATATAPMTDQRNFAQVLSHGGAADVDSTPGDCAPGAPTQDDCAESISASPLTASSITFRTLVESTRGSGVYIDANDAAGTIGIYSSGQPVRYRFEVTNLSNNLSMSNVTITALELGADCAPAPFTIDPLRTTEVDCEWSGGWPPGVTTTTASVRAQPTFFGFPFGFPFGDPVTASDIAIVTVDPAPAIQVTKSVNGAPADSSATAAAVVTGGPVTLGYVVTNRGLESVEVSSLADDREPGLLLDATLCVGPDGLALTAARPVLLAANATIVCSLDVIATAGLVLGTATVQGTGVTSGTAVFDTDAGYYLASPAVASVSISVFTNGIAVADASTAPALALGSRVTWTYVVTNTGNDRLRGVTVTDNREGAATCPATTLLPGEAMTCTIFGTAGLSPYTNTAAVAASGVLSNTPVTAADTSYYRGVLLDAARLLGVTGSSPPLIGSVLGLTILLAGAGMLFLSTRRRRTLLV